MLIIYLIIILISFGFLHFISEYYFIGSLDLIAKRFKIPSDIAGSTLMAAGSSAPEFAIVVIALLRTGQHAEIGVGTIVGSALFNIFIIVGGVMLISRSKLTWQPILRDLIFYAISIGVLFLSFRDGRIDLYEALAFCVIYVAYIFVMFYWKRYFPYKDIEKPPLQYNVTDPEKGKLNGLLNRFSPRINNCFIAFLFSIVLIALLSWALVESAIQISFILGIPELIIGLTIIAIGTSIPDFIASIIVAKKGRPGMAINNAIGSNIFDILIGFGLPWFVVLLFTTKTINVDNSNLTTSLGLLAGSLILLVSTFIITKWRTKKLIGGLLIFLYLSYLLYEIINAL